MAGSLARAVQHFVEICPHVVTVRDLVTKVRIELQGGYFIDLYYNDTLGKYAYTLIHQNQRIIGWDNARHHPDLPNFPHHFHCVDGHVESSNLAGVPERDMDIVVAGVNDLLKSRGL